MSKIESKNYFLLFKTGDAELRALNNIQFDIKNILPIIELTRGRKSKKDKIGQISKRLDRIQNIFDRREICIDLTTSRDLTNDEIDALFVPENGYKNWINFLIELKEQSFYKKIIPVIQIDIEDADFKKNLKLQVEMLYENFSTIAYRNSIADDGCYEDISEIQDTVNTQSNNFLFIIDCEYIAPGAWRSFAEKVIVRINKISKQIKKTNFVLVSTSFPRVVSEVGKDRADTFKLNEIDLFNEVVSNVEEKIIHYGDYGSINPIRNDLIVMSRGWIPRIDVPLPDRIFYYRKRRKGKKYTETYIDVANDNIIVDDRYPNYLNHNWGIKQIELCATGSAPGSSPSFWMSVRMNIHIEQQLRRLGLLK